MIDEDGPTGRRRWSRPLRFGLAALLVLGAGLSCGADASSGSGSGGAPSIARERAAAPAAPADAEPAQGGDPLTGQRAVVRTASLSLDVPDLVAATREIRGLVLGSNGFVGEEQSGGSSASMTVRVPEASLDQVIDGVAALGTVDSRRSSASDVTDQVVDLDARVVSQQASVDRTRILFARAESIGDIAAIEAQLAQREADLNSLQSRLAALRGQVALATLSISLSLPSGASPTDDRDPGFLDGLTAGTERLLRILSWGLVLLGFFAPFLVVIGAVVGLVWWLRRRVRSRRVPARVGEPVKAQASVGAAPPGNVPGKVDGQGPEGVS